MIKQRALYCLFLALSCLKCGSATDSVLEYTCLNY